MVKRLLVSLFLLLSLSLYVSPAYAAGDEMYGTKYNNGQQIKTSQKVVRVTEVTYDMVSQQYMIDTQVLDSEAKYWITITSPQVYSQFIYDAMCFFYKGILMYLTVSDNGTPTNPFDDIVTQVIY